MDKNASESKVPSIREFSKEERENYWTKLREKWAVSFYWYPLAAKPPGRELEVFVASAFNENFYDTNGRSTLLRRIFEKKGIKSIFEFYERTGSKPCEVEVTDFLWICYPAGEGDGEGFWTSVQMDWIIYCSHEDTITLGGWILDEVKSVWPNWKDAAWLGWPQHHKA